MKMKLFSIILCMALVMIVGLQQAQIITQAAETVTCTIDFEAGVHTGPNAGLSLKGDLALSVEPDGSATGTLTQTTGGEIKAVGQVNGRAINLAFEVGENAYIYGVGTLTDYINVCTGYIGGVLAGAKAGDLGDWGYAIGGRAVR